MTSTTDSRPKTQIHRAGTWIGVGAAIGVAYGALFGQLALALALGVAFGSAMDVVATVRNKIAKQ